MTRRSSFCVALVAAVLLVSSVAGAAPGDPDPTFGDGGVAGAGEGNTAFFDVSVDAAGRPVAVGAESFDEQDGATDLLVARFTPTGALDPSFGTGGRSRIDLGGVEIGLRGGTASDGSIVVAVLTIDVESFSFDSVLVRLTSGGAQDMMFGGDGVVELDPAPDANDEEAPSFSAIAGLVVTDRITVARSATTFDAETFEDDVVYELHRLSLSGQPDTSFGGDGIVDPGLGDTFGPFGLTPVGDGFAVFGLEGTSAAVARLGPDGALVESFGDGGIVRLAPTLGTALATSAVADAAGGLVVGGQQAANGFVVRLDGGGDLDETFGLDGVRTVAMPLTTNATFAVLGVETDGRVLVLTTSTTADVSATTTVRRLLADGRLDVAFGDDGATVLPLELAIGGLQGLAGGSLTGTRALLAGARATTGEETEGVVAAVSTGGTSEPAPAAAVGRLAADDRIETAITLSRDLFPTGGANGVVMAASDRFADALVAVALARAENAALLLTPGGDLDFRVTEELRRLLGTSGAVTMVGGTGALAQEVENDLDGLGYGVTRLAGIDRFETARLVAEATRAEEDIVLLATGRDYPDALAAGAAAASVGGVVLLTDGSRMPEDTLEYLDFAVDARTIAVGGAASQAAPDAESLAGANRYETAQLVADRFFPTPSFVGLASGEGFADALSGGAHAAFRGGPLLLSFPFQLAEEAEAYLTSRAPFLERVALYGGSAALDESVEAAVRDAVD